MNKIFTRLTSAIVLSVLPASLCGCWDEKRFEQTGFILSLGIESSKDGKMKLTYTFPVTDPSSSAKTEIITTTAGLLRQGREDIVRTSSKSLEAGEIQALFYSKEIAEKGMINKINEVFQRDPSNPTLAQVIVIDGSPEELLKNFIGSKGKPRPGIYIVNVMERCAKRGFTIETRIFNFDKIYFAPGIDNTAPLIKSIPDGIVVEGSALFSKGKMVGSISQKQNALLLAMMGKLKYANYTAIFTGTTNDIEEPKQGIAASIQQKSRKIDVKVIDNKPVIDIYIKLQANIDEYKWDNFRNEQNLKEVSNHITNELQKDCQNLIRYMQDIDSDPIGIGDIVRAKYDSYWSSIEWHDVYPQIKIIPHVNVQITNYGGIQ